MTTTPRSSSRRRTVAAGPSAIRFQPRGAAIVYAPSFAVSVTSARAAAAAVLAAAGEGGGHEGDEGDADGRGAEGQQAPHRITT